MVPPTAIILSFLFIPFSDTLSPLFATSRALLRTRFMHKNAGPRGTGNGRLKWDYGPCAPLKSPRSAQHQENVHGRCQCYYNNIIIE